MNILPNAPSVCLCFVYKFALETPRTQAYRFKHAHINQSAPRFTKKQKQPIT